MSHSLKGTSEKIWSVLQLNWELGELGESSSSYLCTTNIVIESDEMKVSFVHGGWEGTDHKVFIATLGKSPTTKQVGRMEIV